MIGAFLVSHVPRADPGDIGYQDQAYNGTGVPDPSGSKPESKLWWNDGFWWASLFDIVSQTFHIFKLNVASQTWVDTGVQLDDRHDTRADTLWDGIHLYVASHQFTETPTSGFPSRLYRYSYNAATDQYSLDPGFPAVISNYMTETLVIDKDSTGKLWATWVQNNEVYVNRTAGSDSTWGTPFLLPVSGTTVGLDDISAVVAFGGDKIGILWSNQTAQSMYFSIHQDGQPDTTWGAPQNAYPGALNADDHINFSLQCDGVGRVYAITKTSQTELSAPLIVLLVRDPATGSWANYTYGLVSDDMTRPIVLIDHENRILHGFASSPESGGTIYEKTSPIDAIAFPPGLGNPVIRDASSLDMDNSTSTKQCVDSTTGLVVVATSQATRRYWHSSEPLPASCTDPCSDGNACTQTDTCVSGICTGSNPVVCTASDQCHNAGTCAPATGVCSNPAKPDGSACNDGNPCTQTDTCTAGACTGSNPVVCTASDQCHNAGTCAPATGICSNPAKPDGSACNDGNPCTQTDTCAAGACTGSNPVVCTASDQCHNAGTCAPATGICSNPAKPDGSACNDGNACTQTDTCAAGACTGNNPVVCTASDQCHNAGTCAPATGTCSNPAKPDGSACNDGNACTQTDTCAAGACTGNNPVVCTAMDICHTAGSCNSATGCSNPPVPDGTICNGPLSIVLTPTGDAWIVQDGTSQNHGGDADLSVRSDSNKQRRALVQFDLSSIAACAPVTSARLRLFITSNNHSSSARPHSVHRLSASWTEAGVTWNKRDGTVSWISPGGDSGSATASASVTGTGHFVEWDVTSDVLAFRAGTAANNGWLVRDADPGSNPNTTIAYASSENGTAANLPQLVVASTYCGDGSACTLTDTCIAGVCTGNNLVDGDGDAHGPSSCGGDDCNDSNAQIWGTPGEAVGLRLSHAGGPSGTTTLTWSAPSGGTSQSMVYDTLRSVNPADFNGAAICVETADGPNTTATDGASPPAGGPPLCYLIRARDACPQGQGSLGAGSNGVPRTGRTCP